jgi:hypothetical protein
MQVAGAHLDQGTEALRESITAAESSNHGEDALPQKMAAQMEGLENTRRRWMAMLQWSAELAAKPVCSIAMRSNSHESRDAHPTLRYHASSFNFPAPMMRYTATMQREAATPEGGSRPTVPSRRQNPGSAGAGAR